MKKMRTRLLSLLLVLVTVLSLLPTSALAASSTGTGIKPTSNTNYWTTRLLHDGTPYSYKPPMAAGKMLYCMDRGYGYRWGTPSFLNSYTYTSATGADADAVLKTALAQSGMGELDAQQLENFKWMMTYIVDYKGDIPGSLFMAAQTYVWDHQTFKGEGDGDIDGGGYANADTYETYLGYIDWMLAEKAKEDAAFQKQIEEYAAQGVIATVVEDDTAKWAVWAKSSVKGRQSFFNYYAPRKLSLEAQPGEPDIPPAGTGDITLKKVAAGTTRGLDGARFLIYRDGQIVGSDVTANGGIIEVNDVTKGLWSFVETEAPAGYCADPTPISVYVDTTDGDKQYTVTAENYALPDMKITKRDAMSGKPIVGTVFSIKSVTGSYSTSVTTGTDGSATLSAIPAGVYVVREESVPEPYIVSNTEQTVALRPGKTSEVIFVDYEKPGLEIVKKNIANGEPIEGVTYRIEQIDGSYSTTATTDNHGRIFLDSVPVGTFKVTEINVPSHVILCPIPQEVALKAGETSTVTFFNALKPSLEIRKLDSVTGDPVKGAKFQIWYASNHTDTGELNDLGTYFSDASGKIILPEIKDGWYKVTELEPASGYAIKEPATQECFISGGESKVLTFENTPLSAIIIRKVDSESGQPLEGAWFRIRYLGGTSGTGGTVIGEYRTSSNGTIVVTGLKAGTYVCEEISAPDGYVITDATETVYLSGKDQDVITVTFGNDKMGSLLIVKKDAVTGAPISDVEFFITDSDGSVIGNANGKYVTDSAGTIRIDGLTPGMTVIAKEVRAKDGYILDDTPQSIKIKRNSVMTLEFRNQPKGGVLVKKVDAVTNAPIPDVEFLKKLNIRDGGICYSVHLFDEYAALGLIAEFQRHDGIAFDLDALRRIVEDVAILGTHLFSDDCHAGSQAVNADGACAIGHILSVGVADHAAIRIGDEELHIGNGSAGHGVLFDDEEGTHLIIAEGHGDHVLILTGKIDCFRGIGDHVPVRRGNLLADISACLETGHDDGSIARSAVLADDRATRTGGAAKVADAEPCTFQRLTALTVHLADDDGGKGRVFKCQDFALAAGDEAFLRGRLLDGVPGRRFQFRYFIPAILDLRKNDFSACVRKVSAEVIELAGVGVVAGIPDLELSSLDGITGDAIQLADLQTGLEGVEEGDGRGFTSLQRHFLRDGAENDMTGNIDLCYLKCANRDRVEENATVVISCGRCGIAAVDLLDPVGHALDGLTIGDVLLDNFKTGLFIVNENDLGGFAGAECHGLLRIAHDVRLGNGFLAHDIDTGRNGRERCGAVRPGRDGGGITSGNGLNGKDRADDRLAAHGVALGDLHIGQCVIFGSDRVLLIAVRGIHIDADRGRIGAVPGRSLRFYEAPQALGDVVDLDDAAVCRYIAAHDLTVPVNQKAGTI